VHKVVRKLIADSIYPRLLSPEGPAAGRASSEQSNTSPAGQQAQAQGRPAGEASAGRLQKSPAERAAQSRDVHLIKLVATNRATADEIQKHKERIARPDREYIQLNKQMQKVYTRSSCFIEYQQLFLATLCATFAETRLASPGSFFG
jgi:hypothetical protein